MTIIKRRNTWESEKVDLLDETWEQLAPGVERFRLPGNEPVRRIITGRRNLKVGAFWSWKNNQHVAHESAGEEHCARVLEVHQSVDAYFGQPEQLRFLVEGQDRPVRYTPDFLIVSGGRELRVEYKPYDMVHAPVPANDNDEEAIYRHAKSVKLRERLALIQDVYQRCGIPWRLITDRDLHGMADKEVVDEIVANAGRPMADGDLVRLVEFLANTDAQAATMGQCARLLASSEFPRGDILSRVPERIFSIDLHQEISDDTLVKLGSAAR